MEHLAPVTCAIKCYARNAEYVPRGTFDRRARRRFSPQFFNDTTVSVKHLAYPVFVC